MNKHFFTALATFSFATSCFSIPSPDQGMNFLEQISEAFTSLAETAMPATVSIKCICKSEREYTKQMDPFAEDFFRRFFGEGYGQQPREQTCGGSGFIISPDGDIVTNSHVIKSATQITVVLNDGREYEATVKGTDSRTDLALIKIEEKGLPFLTFGDSDSLKVGEWVVAAGNPFGLEGTITKGIVSAKGRQDLGIATYEDFIQTDAAINPGNSGGPLLNVRGEVIGVNTAIYSRSGGYMGIGLAIPSKMAEQVIDQIMDKGAVKRGYIGIILQPIDKELSNALSLDKQEGILISEVIKDSPADEAGLKQGDIIISYEERSVKNVSKFRNEVALMPPGTKIKLQILRNHKVKTIHVTLGTQSDGEQIVAELTQKLGIELENPTADTMSKLGYSSDVTGVLISKVKAGSPSATAGLRAGFLITGIVLDWNNQTPIKNISEFDTAMQQLGDKKYVILIVRHQNFQRYYTVKLQ